MATTKLKNIPSKGAIGDISFFERNGKIVARQRYAKRGRKVRTKNNMAQQTRYINVVHSWSSFAGKLKGNFAKKPGQTDYNAFVGVNMLDARIFLTRRESELKACVADRFAVSLGILKPEIEVSEVGEWMVSNLELGGFRPSAATRACDLAAALIENSCGRLRWGDELRFYKTENQRIDPPDEVPVFSVDTCVLPLQKSEDSPLEVLSPRRIWELGGWMEHNGRLAALHRKDSLVAWVLRRPDGRGGWHCTSQSLVGFNPLWERYATEEARERAILSYGPVQDTAKPTRSLPPIVDPATETKPAESRKLTPAQRLVLSALDEDPTLTTAQIAAHIGLREATVEELLDSLERPAFY